MNNKEKKLYKSLKKALDNGNYIIAEKLCLEILKNKPDDIFALYNYSCLLCIKGKMNEGKDIIKSILPSLKDSKLQYSLATLAKIYLENKDYDTAYKYLSQYNKNFPREPLFGLESNINAKLYKNQREYDKKQVINHIIKRHGYDPYAPSKFNKNINIPELFEEVTYKLTTTPRLTAFNPFFILANAKQGGDEYYGDLVNCGQSSGENCNYVKVVTNIFENNIITMFPVKEKRVPHQSFTIDYDKEEEKSSQIEKFYKKWGKR